MIEEFKTIEEFKKVVNNNSISFRKIGKRSIKTLLVLGYESKNGILKYVWLGNHKLTPKKLLKNYEFLDNGEWKKFGIDKNNHVDLYIPKPNSNTIGIEKPITLDNWINAPYFI